MTGRYLSFDRRKTAQWETVSFDALFLLTLLLPLVRFLVETRSSLDQVEKPKCNQIMTQGYWLDAPGPSIAGHNTPIYQNWQPEGCMMHSYATNDISKCLKQRSIVYIGDSSVRNLYWATAQKIDIERARRERLSAPRHSNLEFSSRQGPSIYFFWDPFLNSSMLQRVLNGSDVYVSDSGKAHEPAIVDIGGGLWHAKHLGDASTERFDAAINNITQWINNNDSRYPNQSSAKRLVVLNLVQKPWYQSLNSSQSQTMSLDRVESLNRKLLKLSHDERLSLPWVYSSMAHEQSQAYDPGGIHVIDSVASQMVDVLFNVHCNRVLTPERRYPLDKTCCSEYPKMRFSQLFVNNWHVLSLLLWPLNDIVSKSEVPFIRRLKVPTVGTSPTTLYWVLYYCLMADRLPFFAKLQKTHSLDEFVWLCTICVVVGAISKQRSRSPSKKVETVEPTLDVVLSRDQTNEWKGWMQCVILAYHYTGASRTLWIYKIIRLLVGAYLFLTGFGHARFFYKKKDYSLGRASATLLRLNLLSCLLAYVMNTDYVFYYFAPLSSFWYVVVYLTMRTSKARNENTLFLFSKIAIASILIASIIRHELIFERIFDALAKYANVHWNSREWHFRLSLDSCIVFLGMICGISLQIFEDRMRQSEDGAWRISARQVSLIPWIIPILTLLIYVPTFVGTRSKQEYNAMHPYVSVLPILTFVILRNSSRSARSSYSAAFAWVGKYSLETFTLQFHIWMAADTKGILSLGLFSGYKGRWLDFVVLTAVFLRLSWQTFHSTSAITEWLISTTGPRNDPKTSLNGVNGVIRKSEHSHEEENTKVQWAHRTYGRIKNLIASNLKVRLTLLVLSLWFLNLVYL